MRSAERGSSAHGILLLLVACDGDNPRRCPLLDGTQLAKDYQECVAAEGRISPAADGHAAFCTLRLGGWTPEFQQCQNVGGYVFNWDCFCPGNFSGGTECFIFYPEDACPVTQPPDGKSPGSAPVCNCP